MANMDFGDLDFLGSVLNEGGNLLEQTGGIASFSTPGLANGEHVFYVSGYEGISLHRLVHNGTWLDLAQSTPDTAESLLVGLTDVEVFYQNGNDYLIGISGSEMALNVFEIDPTTGFLTFVSAISDPVPLTTTTAMAQLYAGGQSYVVTTNYFNENLAFWELGEDGVLTRVDLLSGPSLPLWGVSDVASFNLDGGPIHDRDGFVTAALFDGLALWGMDADGVVTQRDHLAINGVADVDVGNYRAGTFLLAGGSSSQTVQVIEIDGGQMTEVSAFDLQAHGFFGDVTSVRSFAIDGVRIAVVVTGVGEILLLGMNNNGTLGLIASYEWQNASPAPPIRNADDVELVFIDGQAVLAIAGTQPQVESSLEGVSLFYLGDGNDTLTGGAGDDDLLGFGDADDLFGGQGADRLYGGKGRDELLGGSGADLLVGGLGDDVLSGGTGNDTLSGCAAGDSITGDDSMDGGLGIDTLSYEAARGRVVINLATQSASGKGAAGDVIVGFERVWGSRYDDVLTGGTGDNHLLGNGGNDKLAGGDGHDDLFGGSGEDTLNGEDGDDFLNGSNGLNQLYGGDGNDTIRIGGGTDYARGGAGDDTFDWIPTVAATSRIYDFTQGEDVIDLAVNMTEAEVFAALETIGGVHAYLFINGDRGLIIRNITAEELTAADFIFAV